MKRKSIETRFAAIVLIAFLLTLILPKHIVQAQPQPSPEILRGSYQNQMQVGERQTIAFGMRNNGGSSNPAYLDISLSTGLDVVGTSASTGSLVRRDPDSLIWRKTDKTGPTLRSSYLLYELTTSLQSGDAITIKLTIEARSAGAQWIKYRAAMNPQGMPESNYNPDSFVRHRHNKNC